MVILGIYTGHNASASLMIDGEIIFAVQEERFINFKNFNGYPKKSIDYCIKYVKNKNLKIDIAGFAQSKLPIFPVKYPIEHFYSIEDYHNYYGPSYYSKKFKGENTSSYIKKLIKDKRNNKDLYLPYNKVAKKDYYNPKLFRSIQKEYLLKQSKKLIKKIVFLDHHMCHAYYSFYSSKIQKKNSCVVTIDSMGDDFNQ